MKVCKKCGGPLPVQRGAHRPRVMCETCRPRRSVKGDGPVPAGAVIANLFPGGVGAAVSVRAALDGALAEAGIGGDEAAVLRTLADSLDAGGHSGASLAALSREYFRAKAAVFARVDDGAAAGDGIEWGVG